MNFLICGLGSIGQRHVRLLRKLLGNDATIYAHRRRGFNIVVNDNMTAQEGLSPEQHYGLITVPSFEDALKLQLDGVFVTNPISMHVETAIAAVEHGHNVFIEKPLGCSLENVERLEQAAKANGVQTFTGYQLRFHPALALIKDMLARKAIGRLVAADIHFGEWLPGMHPYEDYRISHAARANEGGGVILCLSHEIDYAQWLFGYPATVFASGGHLSDLELDVEDSASIMMACMIEGRSVPVHVHLDFIQRPARRYCRIVGSEGDIFWDYRENVIELRDARTQQITRHDFPGWQRNDMFVNELSHFLACVRGTEKSLIPIDDAARTLKICLAARQSINSGQAVKLS